MQLYDLKGLQKFLDAVSGLSVSDVDGRYKCKSDMLDTIDGQQIVHYEVTQSFRIHGVYLSGQFEVVRLDPHHRVHNA
jgi:hypothetical protein